MFKETAEPLVERLFESPARSGVVVAYGATNAGKTHTIMGPCKDHGILPRSLTGLFQRVQGTIRVSVRVVEIYMNKAYDLLRTTQERGQPLSFKETARGDEIVGLSEHYPRDLEAALELVNQARNRLPVATTALNPSSSRGHTVWMLELRQPSKGKGGGGRGGSRRGATQRPMLWIVDLAGSERINRSLSHINEVTHNEAMHNEATHINIDISTLFACFKQVEAGHHHISWRGRIITRLLKSMLVKKADAVTLGVGGGGSSAASSAMCCVMIVNINPAATEYGETEKVLSNALISAKARLIEGRPQVLGMESSFYGMNGHLIKPMKGSHLAAGANIANAGRMEVRRGRDRSKAVGAGALAVASQNEQTLLIEEQAREIARLQAEVLKMREELEMMQEIAWNEAQREIQQELFPQIAELEVSERVTSIDNRLHLT